MRNLPAVFFVALAACGGGSDTPPPADSSPPQDTAPPPDTDPPPPDSQVLDLACMANQTAPTTATATVTASGAANSLDITFGGGGVTPVFEPLDEAAVDSCVNDCVGGNDLLDSTSSSALPCGQEGCAFMTGALGTNDVPLDAYLNVSKAGFRTSNIFPSEPLRADLMNIPALVLTPNAFGGAAAIAGVTQNDVANGALALAVTDCANTPVQGATLIVTQNDQAVGEVFDPSSFAAELAGTFIVFNVPEGATTVNAMVNGTMFRARVIQSFAGETSGTQVTPGFAAP